MGCMRVQVEWRRVRERSSERVCPNECGLARVRVRVRRGSVRCAQSWPSNGQVGRTWPVRARVRRASRASLWSACSSSTRSIGYEHTNDKLGAFAYFLTCSLAFFLTCSLAYFLTCSLAYFLTCSLAYLLICSLPHCHLSMHPNPFIICTCLVHSLPPDYSALKLLHL